jgi:hypothetical protein
MVYAWMALQIIHVNVKKDGKDGYAIKIKMNAWKGRVKTEQHVNKI